MTGDIVRSRRVATLRIGTATVIAAVSLGATAGMAQATEYRSQRAETVKTEVSTATAVFRAAGAPAIRFDALEDRFAALPVSPTLQQVLAAMYPNDAVAQGLALQALTRPSPAGAGRQTTTGVQAAQAGWDDVFTVAGCVAAIGAFVAGNAVLVAKLKKLGGVYKGAKLVIQAGNAEERMKALVAVFGDITGLTTVVSSCS
ncbi:hypothetical protein ACFQ6N_39215 [Kitasatospora sp. NPDC056446]|uniref:hypothetical protein n=1 Tax=Kitasatospora sp. NPDC056446 TaxID=3345819 RepID=UPI00368FEACE